MDMIHHHKSHRRLDLLALTAATPKRASCSRSKPHFTSRFFARVTALRARHSPHSLEKVTQNLTHLPDQIPFTFHSKHSSPYFSLLHFTAQQRHALHSPIALHPPRTAPQSHRDYIALRIAAQIPPITRSLPAWSLPTRPSLPRAIARSALHRQARDCRRVRCDGARTASADVSDLQSTKQNIRS